MEHFIAQDMHSSCIESSNNYWSSFSWAHYQSCQNICISVMYIISCIYICLFSLNALLYAVDFLVKLMEQSRGKNSSFISQIVESFRVKRIATMLGSFFTFSSMYSTALCNFFPSKKKITFILIKNWINNV